MKISCISILMVLVCPLRSQGQQAFVDVAEMLGMSDTEGCESVAIGDFNNDGYEDIYLGFYSRANQLWQNNGDGSFEEVAARANVSVGESPQTRTAIWGDMDNDGHLDLYVGNRQRPDKLFYNNGDGTFTDVSSTAGILQLGYPLSVNMADVNQDGYLDIYISNFSLQNVLFINDGDLTFTTYTYQSGALDVGLAMGSIFFDYDRDGDSDLYLVHDGRQPNLLYQNDGLGHFTELGATTGLNTESLGMGVDVGDIDNDGWLDVSIANLYPNYLLHNQGDGTFVEIADSAGVANVGMGWSTFFFDYDNDGLQDIYVANEYQFSPYRNVLYHNQGNGRFLPINEDDPVCNTSASYGAATFDYNLDGQLDVAVANRPIGQGFELFENSGSSGNWVLFKLIGVASNRQAVGAKVEVYDNLGVRHYDELTAGNGWLSQNSQLFHFGLGEAETLDSIIVYWPSGLRQQVAPLVTREVYTIIEGREPTPGVSFDIPDVVASSEVEDAEQFDWQVFPNPTSNQWTIQFTPSSANQQAFELYNYLGQLVWQTEFNGRTGTRQRLSLAAQPLGLKAGLYTLVWKSEYHQEVRRLVLE